ncbi:MAG: D-alanyl-D-alanine carboxypeptidase/D-alanyl-D-alanine-endopeptidase, partial [Legionellales bacterium RIFCSPHIGHO2_12_FULL_42_9]
CLTTATVLVGSLFPSLVLASIASGADHLINQVSPNLNIGIEVVDVTTGVTLYQRNQNKLFIPASNMKLFSDAAALMILGPDYRFRNQLSMGVSELKKGQLDGNLYFKLPGDPSFTHDRLMNLLCALNEWKINRIHGNVVIDSGHANVDAYPPGWMARDLTYSYGAPLSPVMIDANRMLVTVNPAERPDQPAIVEVDGDHGSIVIHNEVKTRARGARCGVSFVMKEDSNELTVRGCIAVGQWAIQQKMAIRNPLIYAQRLIKKLLAEENITLDGNVMLGKTPTGSLLLATDTSKPIAQVMADTLKPSDNLYADSLYLHAAAKLKGVPVNWNEAQTIIKNFLQQQTGIPLQNAILTDGSGLSRNDRVTPTQTVGLLRFLYDRFPLTYEYIAALPISGRDGTLQRRFKRPEQQDLVRAKTGTMTGIVSLSGYVYTANAHTIAFAIFINTLRGTKPSVAGQSRYLVDALCTYFLRQKPASHSWAKNVPLRQRIQYQKMPAQADLQRGHAAQWRRLETVVKHALQGQTVAVIFRGNELLLRDNQANASSVLNALRTLRNKYSFSVALTSKDKPTVDGKPLVLWSELADGQNEAKRTWLIREATN